MQTNEWHRVRGLIHGQTSLTNTRRAKVRMGRLLRFGAGLLATMALVLFMPTLYAQTTAQLSGTVTDPSGAVIPQAQVVLVNEATQDTRIVRTNDVGFYSFPALLPSSYTLKVSAKGFEPKNLTGIILHAGDERTVPAFAVLVGSQAPPVSVEAAGQMIPMDSGQREDVLTAKDIETLALQGRDTTELLKILPGATTVSGGLTQNNPMFSDINVSANESAVGTGINLNGVPNRGGPALLSDGVSVLDPGDNASSIGIISPEMTAEVSVQTSNFGAYVQNGPVVVSAISKSGTSHYHGTAYFVARNDILNANGWAQNHQGVAKAGAHYYYPGGNFGGPVPFTHKKVFIWGGFARCLQNPGNGNVLESYIPSPEMMAGDFSTDNADNNILCPNGFSPTAQGNWCNNLAGTTMSDGTAITPGPGTSGAIIPSQYIDPGANALASFWPD